MHITCFDVLSAPCGKFVKFLNNILLEGNVVLHITKR